MAFPDRYKYYILTIYIVHLLCIYGRYVQLDMQIMMHSYTPQYDSHVRDKLPLICQALLCIAQVQYSEKPYNRATHQLIISQNFSHLSCTQLYVFFSTTYIDEKKMSHQHVYLPLTLIRHHRVSWCQSTLTPTYSMVPNSSWCQTSTYFRM